MQRGRKPTGAQALSNAKRQARYRVRHMVPSAPTIARMRRNSDRRSRPQRWRDAMAELLAIQSEYADWLATLPESLRDTSTADALEAIADLDIAALANIEPPRGYGRDQ